jgi:hypothetical protein
MHRRILAVTLVIAAAAGCGSPSQSADCATLIACCGAVGSASTSIGAICQSSAVTNAAPSGSCWTNHDSAQACSSACTADLNTLGPLLTSAKSSDGGALDTQACQ